MQRRLEEACDFVHCGHLHDPEVTEVVVESGQCITITAGASFESRGYRNAFTRVEFDPLAGRTEVVFIEYNPQTSAYEYESKKSLDHRIDGPCDCTVEELAEAICLYCKDAAELSRYLSSLLLGSASDMPMMSNGVLVFGNWDAIEGIDDSAFRKAAKDLKGVGRAVRMLHRRKPLGEILSTHGGPIRAFVGWLSALSNREPAVRDYLEMRNKAGAGRHHPRTAEPLRHTVGLLVDLMEADDLDSARHLAERTIDVSEGTSRVVVARILALCLARSTEEQDRSRAAELYEEVVESEQAEPGDWGALATLKTELRSYDEAQAAIRNGIERFPNQSQGFVEIGMRLVEEYGDKVFRDWLLAQGRGHSGE